MYTRGQGVLISCNDGPQLSTTSKFDTLLDTLPEGCPIPTPLIEFGLLARHVEVVSDKFEMDIGEDDIETAEPAIIPAETLTGIRWLLYNHSDHLSRQEKKRVGAFCESTRLNRPSDHGHSASAVKKAAEQDSRDGYPFLIQQKYPCEYCSKVFDSSATRNGHLASCDDNPEVDESETDSSSSEASSSDRPAFGKEVRTDKGSERVTGKNPFADTSRIKDAGLHEGGGD